MLLELLDSLRNAFLVYSGNSPATKVEVGEDIYYRLYDMRLVVTTTIAVKESTVERLKRIMKEKETKSLDQTINLLIESAQGVPPSMFGIDRRRRMSLTRREHEEFEK